MSGYLARLVERASGKSLTGTASPAVHAPQPVGDSRDPFESTALPSPAMLPPVGAAREFTESPVQASSPEVAQDRAQHPEPRPPSRWASVPASTSLPLPQAPASLAPFERKAIRQVPQTAMPVPPEPLTARPAELAGPIVEKTPAKLEKLAPPPPLLSPPVLGSSEPLRTVRPTPPPPVAQAADEPRLVIGQMRVEIIPAAVTPPRASSRPRSRSRSAGSASSSRSEFGLGQM